MLKNSPDKLEREPSTNSHGEFGIFEISQILSLAGQNRCSNVTILQLEPFFKDDKEKKQKGQAFLSCHAIVMPLVPRLRTSASRGASKQMQPRTQGTVKTSVPSDWWMLQKLQLTTCATLSKTAKNGEVNVTSLPPKEMGTKALASNHMFFSCWTSFYALAVRFTMNYRTSNTQTWFKNRKNSTFGQGRAP